LASLHIFFSLEDPLGPNRSKKTERSARGSLPAMRPFQGAASRCAWKKRRRDQYYPPSRVQQPSLQLYVVCDCALKRVSTQACLSLGRKGPGASGQVAGARTPVMGVQISRPDQFGWLRWWRSSMILGRPAVPWENPEEPDRHPTFAWRS